MKMLLLFITALVTGPCSSNPLKKIEASEDQFRIYSSKHDIINLVFPLNAVNMDENNINTSKDVVKAFSLFFTEVDLKDNGEKDYKGLYVLKNDTAYKLLENGRDSTACSDRKNNVYFAASDGIYLYNAENKTADKYGTLDDNFLNIVQVNGTDETIFYAINDKHDIYKITDEGTKKEKVAGVSNAQQLVIDFDNNIYFYDQDKEVYVINKEGVTKIDSPKKNPEYIQLLNPPCVCKDCVPLIINDKVYMVYANGTTQLSNPNLPKVRPTGYSLEATFLQFYAYNKAIYGYNIIEIIFDDIKRKFLGH